MGRLWNQFIRFLISQAKPTGLEQDLHCGGAGGEMAFPEMAAIAREAAAEGIVLLKNESNTLPLGQEDKVAVFGRVARDYFAVGYGSGGDTKAPYITNLYQGLEEDGVSFDKGLFQIYDTWGSKPRNIPDQGYWGHWPMSYPEMELKKRDVAQAAKHCNKALVVIGRAAGEDRENLLKPGSYYLTRQEKRMLELVNRHFKQVAVVLDCGNLIDFSWVEDYSHITALVLAWQGGMESGRALADVLCGRVNPCGKLTDTVAKRYEDYPSAENFGKQDFNNYAEDIYVGYRYFETFQREKVLFPFGFGLSYTHFDIHADIHTSATQFQGTVRVTNRGNLPGKEVAQLYIAAPNGKLGKASRVLAGFGKTELLNPEESWEMKFCVDLKDFASYDDAGQTGHRWAYVLEEGEYGLFVGTDVRSAEQVATLTLPELLVVRQLEEAGAVDPACSFLRMVNRGGSISMEPVPTRQTDMRQRILSGLPDLIPMTGDRGIKLGQVARGEASMDAFIAQLTPRELEQLSRGEGAMHSKLGVAGNAGALAGVSESLREKGIPALITTDGPSGIRIQRTVALLPCGCALAASFNPELVERLYSMVGAEMKYHGSDILLGPGMNIHRNPLCGRNFEYYSEDPYLSGSMAAAAVRGIQSKGASACPKHFACNNQETHRSLNDSRISERALREIYLKGFEYMIAWSNPDTIMASYNKINGVWSHYHYDLATTILRKEWGFQGLVLTDWWMQQDTSHEFPALRGSAYRVRAQVDVLMPGEEGKFGIKKNLGDPIMESLEAQDGLTVGELQRTARNVLKLALKKIKQEG